MSGGAYSILHRNEKAPREFATWVPEDNTRNPLTIRNRATEMACDITFTVVLFLMILNGYLRGRWKQQIDIVLGAIGCGIVILGVYSEGWVALIYLAVIWLIGGNLILTPFARMAARKLLS
jgi:hypothetical protein